MRKGLTYVASIGVAAMVAVSLAPGVNAVVPERKVDKNILRSYMLTESEAAAATGFTGTLIPMAKYTKSGSERNYTWSRKVWKSNDAGNYPDYVEILTFKTSKMAKKWLKVEKRYQKRDGWDVQQPGPRTLVFSTPADGSWGFTEVWVMQRGTYGIAGAGCRNEVPASDRQSLYECAVALYEAQCDKAGA